MSQRRSLSFGSAITSLLVYLPCHIEGPRVQGSCHLGPLAHSAPWGQTHRFPKILVESMRAFAVIGPLALFPIAGLPRGWGRSPRPLSFQERRVNLGGAIQLCSTSGQLCSKEACSECFLNWIIRNQMSQLSTLLWKWTGDASTLNAVIWSSCRWYSWTPNLSGM